MSQAINTERYNERHKLYHIIFREGLGSFARRTQRTKKFDPFVLDGLDADSPWYIASYIHVSHRLTN